MRSILMTFLTILFSGCQQESVEPPPCQKKCDFKTQFLKNIYNQLPEHFSIAQLKEYLNNDDLEAASRYVNMAIKVSLSNPALHVINGFIYEEMVKKGDISKVELAGIAYRTAHSLDPTQWLYPYLLGTYELKACHYDVAQQYLADALLLKPDHPDVLYALACASYYLQDVSVALASIQKAQKIKPNDPVVQRSAALIFAASAQFDRAFQALDSYKKILGKDCADADKIKQRICDWKVTHNQYQQVTLPKTISVPSSPGMLGLSPQQEEQADQKKLLVKTPTVVIDCCLLDIIRIEGTSKGNNILSAYDPTKSVTQPLMLVLSGDQNNGNQLVSVTRRIRKSNTQWNSYGTKTGNWTKNFGFTLSIQALNYSLNIANATEKVADLIARPSVSTLLNQPAVFFSSDVVQGTTSSALGSSSVPLDAGIKVEVNPLSIDDKGLITMEVTLTGSAFSTPPNVGAGISEQVIAITKSKTSTTVKVYAGQTIMLAGMHSHMNNSNRSAVPFLGDIPVVQYFFGTASAGQEKRTFLCLVTPRIGDKPNKPKTGVTSPVAKKLYTGGALMHFLASTPVSVQALRNLQKYSFFENFQSDDVISPAWGYENSSVQNKLDQLKSFLYF